MPFRKNIQMPVPNLLYGPVPSRRLGRSLGVDLVPPKTCTYDCIYCEVGPTTRLTLEREPYHVEEIIGEIEAYVKAAPLLPDFLTLAGHKCYAPKGIGALYVRQTPRPVLQPLQFGGGQERGERIGWDRGEQEIVERHAEASREPHRGADIAGLPLSQIAAQVGYVFQDPDHQLFAASVAEEVAFGPRNLIEAVANGKRAARSIDEYLGHGAARGA